MVLVSVHAPLSVVSASPTALNRSETVVHEVDTADGWAHYWQVFRSRKHQYIKGRQETDELSGPVKVRTVCGKDIDGLFVTHQKKRPCEICAKVRRDRKISLLIWPAGLLALQYNYISYALDQHRKSAPGVRVTWVDEEPPPPPQPDSQGEQAELGLV